MFSIIDILNHENITWTLMVGVVCMRGVTQFVCVRLFCPFSDFLEILFVQKGQKVESIFFLLLLA